MFCIRVHTRGPVNRGHKHARNLMFLKCPLSIDVAATALYRKFKACTTSVFGSVFGSVFEHIHSFNISYSVQKRPLATPTCDVPTHAEKIVREVKKNEGKNCFFSKCSPAERALPSSLPATRRRCRNESCIP